MEKGLKNLLEEARESTERLRQISNMAIEEGTSLHNIILETLRGDLVMLDVNLKTNAELFNAAVKQTERDMRIELDRLYRQQLDITRRLLKLPHKGD